MANVSINGVTYCGHSISIIDGRVTIDGNRDGTVLTGVVEIRVTQGTIGELRTDASVACGLVSGNVVAGGSVICNDVGGAVQAGGSVACERVTGFIMAGDSAKIDIHTLNGNAP